MMLCVQCRKITWKR